MGTRADIRSLTGHELKEYLIMKGHRPYRGEQVFRWLWTPYVHSFDAMSNLPKHLREELKQGFHLKCLEPIKVQVSKDGTRKIASRLEDNALIETVIIPEEGHRTVCVSTQVGCAMGCRFCRTARMGFIRDLTPSEIVLQVLMAIEELGGKRQAIRNIVFMGMGEPLMNYENLSKALHILQDTSGMDFSKRRITVSTCGIIPGIERLGQEHQVGLAISLHAPSSEKRSMLMPVNRQFDLRDLIGVLRRYPLAKRRRITIEYLVIRGVNDSPQDALELSRILQGIRVKVNLIPFNEVEGIPFKAPGQEAIESFCKILAEKGYTVTVRKSKGADIDAACGQLYAKIKDNESPRG